MRRKIREILAECKEGSEVMSFHDFKFCVKTIYAHLSLAGIFPDGSRESKRHLKMAGIICHALEDCFVDRNGNLVKWFRHESCEFRHPQSGNDIRIHVRNDQEAIYCFLCYCMKLNMNKTVDDDSLDYLTYILCEPTE